MFGWEWKSEGIKKMNLNKFTHIPMLKNDAQLKQKKWQITTQKEQSPKFFFFFLNNVEKKKITST